MSYPPTRCASSSAVDGVVAVQRDSLEQPQTDVTPQFLGATNIYPQLGGRDRAGQGVIVGVLDTGITPQHPSFRDTGLPLLPAARSRASSATAATRSSARRQPATTS